MAYKYKETIKEELGFISFEFIGNQDEMLKELQEVYRKAKILDEVKGFIIRKLKEEEEKPHALLGDYEYGLYQAYDNVDDIIQEYKEGADDER